MDDQTTLEALIFVGAALYILGRIDAKIIAKRRAKIIEDDYWKFDEKIGGFKRVERPKDEHN